MEKEFVPYEQALALKEIGFNEPCFACYNVLNENKLSLSTIYSFSPKNATNSNFKFNTYAPSYSQAFRWFRENHSLDEIIQREKVKNDGEWVVTDYYMYSINDKGEYPLSLGFDLKENATYEEAELECLKKLIEIIKEWKKNL
jgi:hypothetical protein